MAYEGIWLLNISCSTEWAARIYHCLALRGSCFLLCAAHYYPLTTSKILLCASLVRDALGNVEKPWCPVCVVAGCGVTNSSEAEAQPEGGSRLPAMYGLGVLSSY